MLTFLGICNRNFADKDGANCEIYKNNNWCSSTGGKGPGWKNFWGNFEKYAKGGQTARACPQCGCVSGK